MGRGDRLDQRTNDNPEAERQFAEVKLRACIRIGELSRELEKAKPNKGHGVLNGENTITKEKQLTEAGISVPTAHRYEELTGGKEQQAGTEVRQISRHWCREIERPTTG